jgi:methyl-accepting chemotaxis protein
MRNLGIKAKIWLIIAVFGAGYASILILQQWAAAQTSAHMNIASGTLFPAALSVQEAEAGFQKVKKRYNDAVLLQDKKALAGAEQDGQSVISSLQSVKERKGLPAELQRDVSAAMDKFQDIQSRAKPLYTAMIESPDNISEKTQTGIAALAAENKELETLLASLRENVSKAFREELEAVTVWSQRQRNFGLVVILVAVLVGGTASFFVVSRQIIQPLQQLASRLRDIAQGEGDLTRRLDSSSHDEIGEAAKWFNTFMDKLQKVISTVGHNTNGVAASSDELREISKELSANAQEASSQANQAAAVATEINRNLNTVAHGTAEMTTSIQDIAKNASEAAKVSHEAVAMAASANATLSQLSEAGSQIGDIVKVITSIAEKTNLLALNATIEAARAGEAGAGFAVVANEVKELATQTAEATKHVAGRIEAIQMGTTQAVNAIATIGKIIEQISGIAATIATAVEQQSATTSEMSRNIDQAARGSENITQHTSGAASAAEGTNHKVDESRTAVDELAQMSTELHELVGQFKY